LREDGDLSGIVIADRYELVRRIGRGGMGAVYEARHCQTRKRCAVKLLNRLELSGDAEVVKRFFREARASGTIESDNVVAAYDSGIDSANRLYYVMEYLHGEDLSHTLARVGPLSPAATIKILVQVAAGMGRAHASGIIHRDLKPANLFLEHGADDEITVKILDFGVAKVRMQLFGESSSSLTRGGVLLGTPEYMSPEQLKQASSIDEAADVWSLAVVLFECLTGRLPWGNAESVGEMLAAVLTSPVPSVQDLAPWVPARLAKVARDGLQRDVTKRTRTADGFRASLAAELPGDLRLHLRDIVGPTEAERRVPAERLAFADTLGVGMASDSPVVAAGRQLEPRTPSRAALALGAAGLAGVVGLALSRAMPSSAPAHGPVQAPMVSAGSAGSVAQVAPFAAVPEHRRFLLTVEPAAATVRVDGAPTRSANGRVSLEGPVGSVHEVSAGVGDRTVTQKITILADGLVPASVSFAPPIAKASPAVAKQKRDAAPAAAPAPSTAPPAASVAPSAAELSQKFE
jgi:serine/threonine-protein kinase